MHGGKVLQAGMRHRRDLHGFRAAERPDRGNPHQQVSHHPQGPIGCRGAGDPSARVQGAGLREEPGRGDPRHHARHQLHHRAKGGANRPDHHQGVQGCPGAREGDPLRTLRHLRRIPEAARSKGPPRGGGREDPKRRDDPPIHGPRECKRRRPEAAGHGGGVHRGLPPQLLRESRSTS